MAFLLRHNPNANPDAMLRLTQDVVAEKGVAKPAKNDYSLTFDKSAANNDTITTLTIGGTDYTLDTAIDTTGTDASIKEAVITQFGLAYEAFKTAQAAADPKVGVEITDDLELEVEVDGNNVTITQRNSHFVLNKVINGAPADLAFTATESLDQ